MKEVQADLWTLSEPRWVCITTNGGLRSNGHGIMGAGVAKWARDHYPRLELEKRLGEWIRRRGNHVGPLTTIDRNRTLFVFPTKNDWHMPSPLGLIERSCRELLDIWAATTTLPIVVLGRPGCGLGNLSWEDQVRPVVAHILHDDRFWIAHHGAAQRP